MRAEQRGFTLIEVLITTAITGLIASGLGTAVYQAVTVPELGNSQLLAAHELDNAAHWLRLDGQQASSAAGGSQLTLTMPDATVITYSLDGTSLLRTTGGSVITLARNISAASFTVTDRLLVADMTSAPPGRQGVTRQATYRVFLRPSAEGS